MNRARQDAITTEIMEIVGGAEALGADKGDSRRADPRACSPPSTSSPNTSTDSTSRPGPTEPPAEEPPPPMTITENTNRAEGRPGRRHRRPRGRRRVPAATPCPRSTTPLELDHRRSTASPSPWSAEVAQQIGDSRVRVVCLKPTDGLAPRHRGAQPRPGHHRARRRRRARPRVQRDRRAPRRRPLDENARSTTGRSTARPPASTPSSPRPRCSRPASRSSTCSPPTCRRQDRPVRRRRRGQDRAHPGDDQPRRLPARWCVGVRRRRRAHP